MIGDLENIEQGLVVPVDKPLEWTSSDVVRKAKFILRKRGYRKIKVGHAGTLDPLATGVLILCIGKATKQAESYQAERKEYVAEVTLGATTPSYDMEHPIDRTYPTEHITLEGIQGALEKLTGERLQTPPIYSAKTIDGKRAYNYAREGETVEMRKALITIYNIEILSFEMPKLTIRIECSKGTYIRSLAHEIGEELNSGAYLSGLIRTASGNFKVEECLDIEKLTEMLFEVKQKLKINV